ncbi:carbohydrate porin [Streptomyces sp. TLI_55]|uniref:carbohydrate porin n=1 Tax=Streptomyces sp. TLI_55 TaxID=1938861 RepID=UPI000BE33FC4|nr:carbohydrate porin [Streptomyces sp. TLI_55]
MFDIRAAPRSLATYMSRPHTVYAAAGLAAVTTLAVGATAGTQTVEQRLAALEEWRDRLPDELDRREQQLSKVLRNDFRGGLAAVEKTIGDRIEGLRDYVRGGEQAWWRSYRGPIVLGVGVLVGLAGNIVSSF